jgi:hypothetical protein
MKKVDLIANYNTLITSPKFKLVAQHVVTYIIIKQQLTCSNCGKTGHVKETCHNRKRKFNLQYMLFPLKLLN